MILPNVAIGANVVFEEILGLPRVRHIVSSKTVNCVGKSVVKEFYANCIDKSHITN